MGTLGTYLRDAREARGLDLRDAAQQTRISVNYLRAIEEEDFSKLPGEVFVKGFLRNYAKFLRLPEDEVVARYGQLKAAPAAAAASGAAAPAPEQPKNDRPRPAQQEHRPAEQLSAHERKRNLEPMLWAGVGVIAVVALLLTVLPGRRHAPAPSHSAASSATTTAAPASGAAPTAAPVPDKLYLEIEAREDTWVLVRIDTSPQKNAVLKKGDTVTWSANERFVLSYRSVNAAVLQLNGKQLIVSGPKEAIVRDLTITAAGIAAQKVEGAQKPRKPKPVTQATSTAVAPQAQAQRPPEQAPAPLPAAAPAPDIPALPRD